MPRAPSAIAPADDRARRRAVGYQQRRRVDEYAVGLQGTDIKSSTAKTYGVTERTWFEWCQTQPTRRNEHPTLVTEDRVMLFFMDHILLMDPKRVKHGSSSLPKAPDPALRSKPLLERLREGQTTQEELEEARQVVRKEVVGDSLDKQHELDDLCEAMDAGEHSNDENREDFLLLRLLTSQWSAHTIGVKFSALKKLYKRQLAEGGLESKKEPFRHEYIIVNSLKKLANRKHRLNYKDAGEGQAHTEGLRSWGHVRQVLSVFWRQPSSGEGLRNACATIIQIASMFRGDNVRSLRLNDLWHLPMPGGQRLNRFLEDSAHNPYAHLQKDYITVGSNSDYTNYDELQHQIPSIPEGTPFHERTHFAVCITTLKGKTNPGNRADHQGCMRHRDVQVCPIAHLGAFLFWRFHICGPSEKFPHAKEPVDGCLLPSFEKRDDWYDLLLFSLSGTALGRPPKSRQDASWLEPLDAFSDVAHCKFMKKAYERVGIKSHQPTHSLRQCGAQLAQANGVNTHDIEDHGKWRYKASDRYISPINLPAMRALAGFKPYAQETGSYYLERAEVIVPEELKRKVFAGLDYWIANPPPQDKAGRNMIALLEALRTSFLQDAPHLKCIYPEHALWNHPVFNSYAFKMFELDALEQTRLNIDKRSAWNKFGDLAPDIAHSIDSVDTKVDRIDRNLQEFKIDYVKKEAEAKDTSKWQTYLQVSQLKALARPLMLTMEPIVPLQAAHDIMTQLPADMLSTTPIPTSTALTGIDAASARSSTNYAHPGLSREIDPPGERSSTNYAHHGVSRDIPPSAAVTGVAADPPTALSPDIQAILKSRQHNIRLFRWNNYPPAKVQDLWLEYTVGVQPSGSRIPPSRLMYDQPRPPKPTFPNDTEVHYWGKMEKLFRAIDSLRHARKYDDAQAVQLLEDYRVRSDKQPLSLNKLAKRVIQKRKEYPTEQAFVDHLVAVAHRREPA